MRHGLGAAFGLAADRLLGEPPQEVHPVVGLGTVMRRAETHLWNDSQLAGVGYASVGIGIGLGAGTLVGNTCVATYLAAAGRSLSGAASRVADALERDDLHAARALLPALVGRDVNALEHKEIARAVIESVAENTVDAIVAPALWAAFAGARGALTYRVINTLDAMVGHRNDRYANFGWAAARLDDAANWVPARCTAGLVAMVRPRTASEIWRAARDDAPAHPSPNSGVAEAAFAAALGLRLGGPISYDGVEEIRPTLGMGRPPEPADIAAAIRLSRDVTTLLGSTLLAGGLFAKWRMTRPRTLRETS